MREFVTEVDILLGNKPFSMKPTFKAISEIEKNTGLGFLSLVRKFQSGEFRISDIVEVISAGIKAGDNENFNLSKEQIGEIMMADGLSASIASVTGFFSLALGVDGKE